MNNSNPESGHFGCTQNSWKFKLGCVWGGQLFSTLTSAVLQMGLIWHITLLTQSASMLSVASFAGFLPLALFGIFAGVFVDRLPLKRVLVGSDLLIAGVSALLALVSLAMELPVWLIVLALFLRAIGSAFYAPASQALTPQLAPPEYLTRLAGITQAVQSGGYIIGAALAAVIYPIWGLTAMIALDVLGALIATATVFLARLDIEGSGSSSADKGITAQVRSVLTEAKEGFFVLKGHRGLFALLWCGFAFTLIISPVSALFPLMTLGHFGGTTAGAAAVEIVFSIGMLVGSALLAATGGFKNRAVTVVAATALFGAATLVSGMLGVGGFTVFLAMSFIMGFSSPFYSGPQVALMQEKISPEYLGRVFGLYGAIMSWALPLGLVFSSLFADGAGVAVWFAGSGVFMLLLALATWLIPSIRGIERVN